MTSNSEGDLLPVREAHFEYDVDGGLTVTAQLSHFSPLGFAVGIGFPVVLPQYVGPIPVPGTFEVLGGVVWTGPEFWLDRDGVRAPLPSPVATLVMVTLRFTGDGIIVSNPNALDIPVPTVIDGGRTAVYEKTQTYQCLSAGIGSFTVDFQAELALA